MTSALQAARERLVDYVLWLLRQEPEAPESEGIAVVRDTIGRRVDDIISAVRVQDTRAPF